MEVEQSVLKVNGPSGLAEKQWTLNGRNIRCYKTINVLDWNIFNRFECCNIYRYKCVQECKRGSLNGIKLTKKTLIKDTEASICVVLCCQLKTILNFLILVNGNHSLQMHIINMQSPQEK
jgi:hypothetical protein